MMSIEIMQGRIESYQLQLDPGLPQLEGALMPLCEYVDAERVVERVETEAEKVIASYVRRDIRPTLEESEILTLGIATSVWRIALDNGRRLQRFHADGRLREDLKDVFDTRKAIYDACQTTVANQANAL